MLRLAHANLEHYNQLPSDKILAKVLPHSQHPEITKQIQNQICIEDHISYQTNWFVQVQYGSLALNNNFWDIYFGLYLTNGTNILYI